MLDSRFHPTEEQRSAIDARAPIVVLSSGAGCGKTAVLTQRYLEHLNKQEATVGQLAAITFTDRAAREMRGRIRREILRARDAAADREPWDEHLRDLETADIATIHSFCTSLLRRHALVIGLHPQFDVLDETLAGNVRSAALDEAFESLLTAATPAADDLRRLIETFGAFQVRSTLRWLLTHGDPDAQASWLDRSVAEIVDHWLECGRDLEEHWIEHAIATTPAIREGLRALRRTRAPGPIMQARMESILRGMESLPRAGNRTQLIEELRQTARVQGAEKPKDWHSESDYEAVRDALARFRDNLDALALSPIADRNDLIRAAEIGQQFIRVTIECRTAYDEAKRKQSALDFQDLLVLTRRLVNERADVAESIRAGFRFVLLDELQDTDPIQMDLIGRIAGGAGRPQLFAVGDKKQSIYRFRGADVEQFNLLRDRAAPEVRLSLTRNFRSQPGIIRFVNALFRRNVADYEPLSAVRDQPTDEPIVEFLWTPADGVSADEARRAEASRIAQRIERMVRTPEPVVVDSTSGRLRPARLGDIILLFRAMSNVAIYEQALHDRGLAFHVVGGRAFFAQQEVYDLLNLLRALENPHDALSLAGTLRSPLCGLSDDALTLLCEHANGLWTALNHADSRSALPSDDRPVAERAARFFQRWRSLKDRLALPRLIQVVLDDCGYDAALQFEKLGDRKLANLWKLIDLARQFDRGGQGALADFIHRLGEMVRDTELHEEQAATLPQESDVVRLMTIHQAKGEEFPVVFVPDVGAKVGGAHRAAADWDAELGCVPRLPDEHEPRLFSPMPWELRQRREALADWHEAVRIFYVACTRARDFLVLSGAFDSEFTPRNAASHLLASQFDLDTGECLDRDIPALERPNVRVVTSDEPAQRGEIEHRTAAPLREDDWLRSQVDASENPIGQ